jgi:hypothetical protein
MKSIGHLDCGGGTLFGGRGINAATIPTNHFYAWMTLQPGLQALDRTIGQQVDDLTLIQIHQNGPVTLPLTPCPVVYSNVADWIAGRSAARSLNQPNYRIVADRDCQPVQNTTAWQTACCVADQSYDLADSCRPARMGSRDLR